MQCIVSSWFSSALPPLFLGRKVQHLKLKHTSAVPLRLLAWCQQPQHRAFIWASKCGGGNMGEGSGEEREGKLNAKRETNKQEKWGGVGRRRSFLSFKYHFQWLGCKCKAFPVFPCGVFVCYRHFPCWEDSCHPSHILCTEKAALPWAWWLRLCPWSATLSVVPKAV